MIFLYLVYMCWRKKTSKNNWDESVLCMWMVWILTCLSTTHLSLEPFTIHEYSTHVMGTIAMLFDLSALLPWHYAQGRKAADPPHPSCSSSSREENGPLWAWRCSSGCNQPADFCKADLVPQTHFLLSADVVRNWGTLELTLSGNVSAPCCPLIIPIFSAELQRCLRLQKGPC